MNKLAHLLKSMPINKSLVLVLAIAISNSLDGQTDNPDTLHHEVKLNIFNTTSGLVTFSYDYILDNDQSIGIEAGYGNRDVRFAETQLFFQPRYRFHFGEYRAQGLFLQGHVEAHWGDPYFDCSQKENMFSPGIGAGAGYKLVKKKWIFEIDLRSSRLFAKDCADVISGMHLIAGRRF